jgi:O-antigen/teichoic acid export membrane protein
MVPRFGLQAAAIMTVLTEAVLVGQYLWIVRKTLSVFSIQRTLLMPALAAVLMGILTAVLHGWVPVVVNMAISMLFYLILLFLLRIFGNGSVSDSVVEIKNLLINSRNHS